MIKRKPIWIRIWKCWFFNNEGNWSTRRKTLRARWEQATNSLKAQWREASPLSLCHLCYPKYLIYLNISIIQLIKGLHPRLAFHLLSLICSPQSSLFLGPLSWILGPLSWVLDLQPSVFLVSWPSVLDPGTSDLGPWSLILCSSLATGLQPNI